MGSGGSYKKTGDKIERTAWTKNHPDGNRPRGENGKSLNQPVKAMGTPVSLTKKPVKESDNG